MHKATDDTSKKTVPNYRQEHTYHQPSRALISRVLLTCALLISVISGIAQTTQTASSQNSAVPPLASADFTLTQESEVTLEIAARARGASWGRRNREAAALTVTVDGAYHSDILLWAGDEKFTYKVHLGRIAPGKHIAAVRFNPQRSATEIKRADEVEIETLRALPVPSPLTLRTDDAAKIHHIALAHSPVLYARANSIDRFTDVPLLMYYEATRDDAAGLRLRYTAIFSHEDGGTPTPALMARWGRASDIEWVYELLLRDGVIAGERFQGVEHETKIFTGERINGAHPLLAIASDNNNFSDLACSAMRFALVPVRADFSNASREQLMDENAWTYRVMAEELLREGRITGSAATNSTAYPIAHPREYLYVEAYAEQQGTSLSIEARLAGDARAYSSDLGDARLRVDRSGYFRIATRLPPTAAASNANPLEILTIRCHSTDKPVAQRFAGRIKLNKVFMLDANYLPREVAFVEKSPSNLRPGEAATFQIKR